jgi:cell division septation protein DedD
MKKEELIFMRIINTVYGIFLLCLFLFQGCNSTNYEIIEEPAEITENDNLTPASYELPKDLIVNANNSGPRETETSTEYITVDKTSRNVTNSVYVIQIGAFVQKDNALRFMNMARADLGDAYVKLIENSDLIRVIYGRYDNISEAESNLKTAKHLGYYDAFIRKSE